MIMQRPHTAGVLAIALVALFTGPTVVSVSATACSCPFSCPFPFPLSFPLFPVLSPVVAHHLHCGSLFSSSFQAADPSGLILGAEVNYAVWYHDLVRHNLPLSSLPCFALPFPPVAHHLPTTCASSATNKTHPEPPRLRLFDTLFLGLLLCPQCHPWRWLCRLQPRCATHAWSKQTHTRPHACEDAPPILAHSALLHSSLLLHRVAFGFQVASAHATSSPLARLEVRCCSSSPSCPSKRTTRAQRVMQLMLCVCVCVCVCVVCVLS